MYSKLIFGISNCTTPSNSKAFYSRDFFEMKYYSYNIQILRLEFRIARNRLRNLMIDRLSMPNSLNVH